MEISKFKKINDYEWEIPKQGEMRVPGKIFASKKLIEEMDEKVWEQISNVATLPGIQRASIAMADAHWGYGFPIGGVGAFDADEGVVSVGGVGFDGGCLSGDTKILHEHGYRKKFADFEQDWKKERIKCVNPTEKVQDTTILRFIKWKKYNKVFRIKTEAGYEVIATEDHPFFTKQGMKFLRNIDITKENVSVYPFKGIDYEEPSDEIIITKEDIKKLPIVKNKTQAVKELEKRGLIPLSMNSLALPYLLKLFGYNLGDGTAYFTKNKGILWFYGSPEDLEEIRKDIEKLGFKVSRVYSRTRKHKISTSYGNTEFERTEHSIKTTSSSLALLLMAMGLPFGNKASQDFQLPGWIFKCKKWQKRLLLAAFFGAELTIPKTASDNEYNFSCPMLSIDKVRKFRNSGRTFLTQISKLLREFSVKSNLIKEREEYITKKKEKSFRLRLLISSHEENLIYLWSKIGYEYNKKRNFLANVAVQYLRLKQKALNERKSCAKEALRLRKGGLNSRKIYELLKKKCRWINFRFITRTLYEGRKTEPRIAHSFPTFKQFLSNSTRDLGETGQVWDKIIEKEELDWKDYVYDFTVADEHHNFIANRFVVSNCGVRSLKTTLTLEEVQPKIKLLIDKLFEIVPAGLGSRGKILLSNKEVNEVLTQGAKWVVEKGYGTEEDLAFIEDNGTIKGALPEAVTEMAMRREKKQVGTLGSGNHYLEVQYIDEIYDENAAKAFGLEKGQVMIWIHCGSRALGHQIGTDYLKVLAEASRKYNIPIHERELVCAPINSSEGQRYFGAMCCALNYAHANRQVIAHLVQEGFKKVFPKSKVETFYEISHNSCKAEKHVIEGKNKIVYVHRKGATRAFGPEREELPRKYRNIGQPVLIGGTMGTFSYILHGTRDGEKAFYSACHGAGRAMSRTKAKKQFWGSTIVKELEAKGVYVKAHSMSGLAEEAPGAYKAVEDVIDAVHNANLARKVARLKPIGNIKG